MSGDPATLTGAALNAYRAQESQVIVSTYLGLASVLLAIASVVWARRNRLSGPRLAEEPIWRAFGLLRRPRFGFGALGIFLYVGAEVAIGLVIITRPLSLQLCWSDTRQFNIGVSS